MEFELILKNLTGSELLLDDLGWNIPDGTNDNILEQFDFGTLAASTSLELAVSNGSIVVNDGTDDLSISDGLDFLRRSNRYYVNTEVSDLRDELQPEIDNIQSELDDTQAGSGLSSVGTYIPESSSNYLSSATSLKDADNKLDTQVKITEDLLDSTIIDLSNETTSRTNSDNALQSELNDTQTGAGLETDGLYIANSSTNYLVSATSLKDADEKLDIQVKSNTDAISAIGSGSITNLQTELDDTQVGAGLEIDGSYLPNGSSNYLVTTTSLKDADNKLDNQINLNRIDIDSNITDIETNTSNIAVNSADISINITNITNNANAISTEITNRTNADIDQQTELDTIEIAVGLNTDGSWNGHTGTNYLNSTTNTKEARESLDTQIKINTDNISQEVTDRQTNDDLKVNKSGDTMTGDLTMGSHIVTTTTDPGSPNELTRKGWVDAQLSSIASGYDPKIESKVTTTSELPTSTYDNGSSGVGATLTANANGVLGDIDGISLSVDDRIIVKDQSTALQNGIYVVTSLGDTSNPWILTRATDFNSSSNVSGGSVSYCSFGTINGGLSFIVIWDGPIDVGTNPINFAISSGASTSAIQGEIDTIETSSGLNADGSWSAHSGTGYLDGSTNAKDAREDLDTQIQTNASNIVINAQDIVTNTNNITTNTNNIISIKTLTDNMTMINGVIFGNDTIRNKWIGPILNYGFGRARSVKNRYLKLVGDISSNQSGIRIHRSMCITSMSIQLNSTASNQAIIEIRKNNVATVIGSITINGVTGMSDDTLNIDLVSGDYLQVYVNAGAINYPYVNITAAYSESF